MGSEDADLEELGSITVDGVAYTWQTQQTGAVGRMKVDKALVELMRGMQGQLGVLPYGKEIIKMFEEAYSPGKTIQMATFDLVNRLFGEYGLIVLIPDNANLKKLFQPVVERELTERFSSRMLKETIAELEKQYKPQAEGRELNLFYLIDDARERIVITDSKFQVPGLRLEWSLDEILEELNNHPERFSPNVILRGTLQETILPNIAFVGGGGELAYWLELKDVFESAHIPYPMLLLRNSFLILENKYKQMIRQLGLQPEDLFESEHELMKKIVTRNTENKVRLNGELQKVEELYDEIMGLASNVDATLKEHVAALKTKAVYRLQELEKKMIRAEKRKYGNELLQLQKIKRALFPHNSLQERVENIAAFYGKYGKEFIGAVEQCSRTLQQEFAILEI
jgi:bacillithiol biosynthesis cysteine-adding enzyme BshC